MSGKQVFLVVLAGVFAVMAVSSTCTAIGSMASQGSDVGIVIGGLLIGLVLAAVAGTAWWAVQRWGKK